MTSSCGDDAGKLAYHVTALLTSESQVTCSIRPLTDDYKGDTSVLLLIREEWVLLLYYDCVYERTTSANKIRQQNYHNS